MKYHKHEIRVIKVAEDFGYDDPKIYEIYKDDEYITTAYSLSTAKAYIDNEYDSRYL